MICIKKSVSICLRSFLKQTLRGGSKFGEDGREACKSVRASDPDSRFALKLHQIDFKFSKIKFYDCQIEFELNHFDIRLRRIDLKRQVWSQVWLRGFTRTYEYMIIVWKSIESTENSCKRHIYVAISSFIIILINKYKLV